MTILAKRMLQGVGLFIAVLGALMLRQGQMANDAFARDPACRSTITVATLAARGNACRIVSGSVARVYSRKSSSRRSSRMHYHVVVAVADRAPIDVELESSDRIPLFDDAERHPGDRAVVETLQNEPMLVATEVGVAEAEDDPRSDTGAGILLGAIGLVVAAIGRFVPRRQTPPKSPGRRAVRVVKSDPRVVQRAVRRRS